VRDFLLICLSSAHSKRNELSWKESRRTDEINLLLKITRHFQETASKMEKQFLHDIKASVRRRRETEKDGKFFMEARRR
jgi:hypothetical protein